MRELSIFVDESGDFGPYTSKSPYYIITFVLHNQNIDINENIYVLKQKLSKLYTRIEYIHLGPIIRRESVFNNLTIDERRKYVYTLLNFINSIDINHFSVIIHKKNIVNKIELTGKLGRMISQKLDSLNTFLNSFHNIIVYYDNGQIELSSLLNAILSIHFPNVEFRKAEPQNYSLLQVADFISTMELLKIKKHHNMLSASETNFFYKPKELTKTFFKSLDKKELRI